MAERSIEQHPLQPFLPPRARLLMLGSFPPKRERWSMDFFYPNRQNDMWRIVGKVFFDDAHYFELKTEKDLTKSVLLRFAQPKV